MNKRPKDLAPWTWKSLFGPPPKIGGLYKALDIMDCNFEDIGWAFGLSDSQLPFKVGDVIMVIAWEAVPPTGNDDNSTWGQWVKIDVLGNEKVTRFTCHRQEWNRHFERMKK